MPPRSADAPVSKMHETQTHEHMPVVRITFLFYPYYPPIYILYMPVMPGYLESVIQCNSMQSNLCRYAR